MPIIERMSIVVAPLNPKPLRLGTLVLVGVVGGLDFAVELESQ